MTTDEATEQPDGEMFFADITEIVMHRTQAEATDSSLSHGPLSQDCDERRAEMPYTFRGRLCGYICEECVDPLSGVLVRFYRHREGQNVAALAAASPKETFIPQDEDALDAKERFLLAEGRTDDTGRFSIELPDEYDGEAFEIDVRIDRGPHGSTAKRASLQFTITTLQPRWRETERGQIAAWDYCLPARYWCWALAQWAIFAICGRVTVCRTEHPVGGVQVTAFDVDWIEDDPLGSGTTDSNGKFLIFYSAAAYLRTPIPWIHWEWFHGPDLYFRVDHVASGTALLVEPRSRGREQDRENVGPCVCVDLCLEEPPPPPEEPPPVFQRVGVFNFLTDIDSAPGGTGKTVGDNRAFFSTVRLNGVLAKKLGGQPLEYAFLVTEVDGAGSPIGPTTQVTPAQIARTRIGSLAIFAPTGPGDPNPIKLKDYTVNGTAGPNEVVASFTPDGWIKVPQESDVFSGGFFTPSGDMINLITRSIASWPPIDMTGHQAGQTAGPIFAQNKFFRIEMRIRPQGGAESSGGVLLKLAVENTLYNNISHHPSWNPFTESNALAVAIIDIQQLMGPGAGCTEITTTLDVLVTAAHPNLGPVTVTMAGPSGTLEFIEPPPTPNEVAGTCAVPTPPGSPPPPVWSVATLPPCAYVVQLSVSLLLTTGDTSPLPLRDFVAFCKG